MKCPNAHEDFARRVVSPDLRPVQSGRGELLGWECPLCHAVLWLSVLDKVVLRTVGAGPLSTRQVLRTTGWPQGREGMRMVRESLWRLVEYGLVEPLDRQGWCRPWRWVLRTAGMQTAGMQTAGSCRRLEGAAHGTTGRTGKGKRE